MKKTKTSNSKKSSARKSGKALKAGLKSAGALNVLSRQIPKKIQAVQKLKDHGSSVLEEARELMSEAGENIPASARKSLKQTSRKVIDKLKANPRMATAAAVTVAAVGAGIMANRLISVNKT